MRALVVLLATSLVAVSGVPTSPQRIVGGSLTTVSEYPTIVALLFSWNTNYVQNCGGTILTQRAILTAAHCPYGDTASRWRVRAGSSYANSGGTVYTLSSIAIHPQYNSRTMDSDVAILRTSSQITFSNVVQPASIAGANYNLGDNQVVWAAGWGATSVWTVNQSTCATRYSYGGGNITPNMLCSGWLDVGGRDQCQGDSGGPLYHNGIVVGVCSWGFGCALSEYPGVNARVSRFSSWIQSNA